MNSDKPCYIQTMGNGLLQEKVQQAAEILQSCTLCPRKCRVNRQAGEKGICRTTDQAMVYGYHAHFGEEAPLVGRHGSGTIFFTHCNLKCNFCQNFEISHKGVGKPVSNAELADMMLELQKEGCHNINFVTPSHVVPRILAAVKLAAESGLTLPLIYNTSAYDSVETLRILDGVVDIYMPDFKFWDPRTSDITCGAPDYPDVARKAILEMHRQVGDLVMDASGLARRGLLIRHLVMPDGLSETLEIMKFIATKISVDTYVNIMPQYHPSGDIGSMKSLRRQITPKEHARALQYALEAGLTRIDERRIDER
ncbi:MAG: radical SAM protein [Deltaproteobacteria bacterium]|nr:radical SAM protein [Deltaproteobacteria bacterium]